MKAIKTLIGTSVTLIFLFIAAITFIFLTYTYYDGPDLTNYDVEKIRIEGDKILSDEIYSPGLIRNIPVEATYLKSLNPNSIYRSRHGLHINVWRFLGKEKGFTLYASTEDEKKYSERSQETQKISERLYKYYVFD